MSSKSNELTKKTYLEKEIKDQEIKTTNVNILLNRVRQDKKKNFKKKLLFSLFILTLTSSVFFLII
tara:strand:+ start:1081 stop:1278 length:198 start_codon:yes stop_codon:yes gene_type:complete